MACHLWSHWSVSLMLISARGRRRSERTITEKQVDGAQGGTAGRPPGRKPHYRRRSGRPPASAPDGSTRRKGRPRGPSQRSVLLDLDPGAGFLELSLDLVGLLLRDAFLDGVRSSVDAVLGLLQAQPRARAADLDHLGLPGPG